MDGGYFGDDTEAQKNLLFSARMWRKYNKPRLAKLFEPFRERGLLILMHSDGQIQKILSIVAKRCFISEKNQRVSDLAKLLPSGDADVLADLFGASCSGARDLFGIGAPAMETMMQAMSSGPGIVAVRQAGAGFGGCMVALVKEEKVADISDSIIQRYTTESGIQPQIYSVAACRLINWNKTAEAVTINRIVITNIVTKEKLK